MPSRSYQSKPLNNSPISAFDPVAVPRASTLSGFLFFFAPTAFILLALLTFYHFRSPFYLLSFDPSYLYLNAVIELGTLQFTEFVDNPGIPVQLFGTIVSWGAHLVSSGPKNFVVDVIENSEFYIGILSLFFIGLNLAAMHFGAMSVFRRTSDKRLYLLMTILPILSSNFIAYRVSVLSSESLTFGIAYCLCVCCILDLLNEGNMNFEKKVTWAYSAVIALGIMAKLTFVPLALVPFVSLNSWKHRLQYLLFTSIFIALLLIPMLGSLDYFFKWIVDISTKAGGYGQSDERYVWNFKDIYHIIYPTVKCHAQMVVFTLLNTAILVIVFLRQGHNARIRRFLGNKNLRVWAASLIVVWAHYFILAKQFRDHYSLPYCALSILPIVCFYFQQKSSSRESTMGSQCFNYLYCALLIVVAGYHVYGNIDNLKYLNRYKNEKTPVKEIIYHHTAGKVLSTYPNFYSVHSAWSLAMTYESVKHHLLDQLFPRFRTVRIIRDKLFVLDTGTLTPIENYPDLENALVVVQDNQPLHVLEKLGEGIFSHRRQLIYEIRR